MKKGIISVVLGFALGAIMFGGSVAYAAGETDTAVNYLVQQGIYQGDSKGSLNLDKGLTRAELAVILTRLDFVAGIGGLAEWDEWGAEHFADPENRYNKFADIPSWALPYVEYCYQMGYMKGATETQFNPQGAVTPQMVCTVMLRYCRIAETDWSYNTSVAKAQAMGLAPDEGVSGSTIRRDTVAVIIYRSLNYTNNASQDALMPTLVPESMPTPVPESAEQPQEFVMTIDEMKAEIVRLTNAERVKAGVPELEVLPVLMDCAQAKAQDFFDSHYYGHTSPVYGTAGEMIKAAIPKAKSYGENIAPWREKAQGVFEEWTDSPGHRANILAAKFTHVGVGIVEGANGGYWFVQQFVAL